MTLSQAQQERLYDAERNGSAYIKPELSPLEEEILTLLLEISAPDPEEYAGSFKRGYRDGQAIARALIAEEHGADIDTIIKQLENAGL